MKGSKIATTLYVLIFILGIGLILRFLVFTSDKSAIKDIQSGKNQKEQQEQLAVFLSDPKYEKTTLFIEEKPILDVLVATSEEQMELGLSNRPSMPQGAGMLFSFSEPASYTFWMKDMKFPLDMIWFDAKMRVIGSALNVSPKDFPATYTSASSTKYVLEINAGEAQKLGLIEGVRLMTTESKL